MKDDPFRSSLSEVRREPLSTAVARQLRDAILSGEIEVGTALPSESTLGERLGVGRSTVREALRILQAQGLVSGGDRVTTRQLVVGGPVVPRAAEALSTVVALGRIPVADLLELRLLLETAVVQAAVQTDTPERSAALDDAAVALQQARQAGTDLPAFLSADLSFHEALARASGNAAFALVMRVLRGAMEDALHDQLLAREEPPDTVLPALCREHEALYDAVVARDPKRASTLLRAHLQQFYGDAT